jgi:hypothetical protein
MKNLLLIFTLLFSTVVFSSSSYAGWTKVGKTVEGNTHYVDFERIRKVDGYVYYWILSDYLKPIKGHLSEKLYNQGDCKLFRHMYLSASFHKEPMGRGNASDIGITNLQKWIYPSPDSVDEAILKAVCSR